MNSTKKKRLNELLDISHALIRIPAEKLLPIPEKNAIFLALVARCEVRCGFTALKTCWLGEKATAPCTIYETMKQGLTKTQGDDIINI